MKVNSLETVNYRNIENIRIEPCDTVNIIYGENAQGKTNLLESLWLFTGCRSFRGSKEQELISFDKDFAKLSMTFSDDGREHEAEIILADKKKAVFDGVEHASTSVFFGEFLGIIFAPQHLSLVKGGPYERRKFLNMALCQLRPKYENVLSDFNKILEQRNALLKDIPRHSELLDTLDIWDERLANYSAIIMTQRLRYLEETEPFLKEIYSGISGGKEEIGIKYETPVELSGTDREGLSAEIFEALKAARPEDIKNGSTSVGPHRDDLLIMLDGLPVRSFGSQGQQRSCALSLKLAEAAVIKKLTGKQPVAFLDDVMSELDSGRQDYILNHIDGWQVFITCCDPSSILKSKTGKVFEIKGGQLCSST
ncbi:MAG: DNA replication/repair protein RecF [Clostridia bacterium]|nr:DNA replication/repair protein RecF [Clostridia bacterium]MBR5977100.1 DNA replication/repair protein RecF [Clostridia bacterium]MBR6479048.1 DNA replication/repair protein RecF [Clostridia bacterium]MBR6511844.1 DNA replication/repair protein RecF [Clostridia bacterium]